MFGVRHPERFVWMSYAVGMVLLAAIFFVGVKDLGLDIHDDQMFRNNEALSEDFGHFFLPAAQKENDAGRPLAELCKWFFYLLRGNDAAAYHFYVVAVHLLASILLARVCWRLGLDLAGSLAAGFLFLVHAGHFQAVYHISALDYPLALVWTLGAVLCCLHYLETGRDRWLGGFGASGALALMSHMASAAAVPLGLFLVWQRRPSWQTAVCLGAVGAALGLLALYLLGGTGRETSTWQSIDSYARLAPLDVLAGMGRMLLWLLGRLFSTAHWMPFPFIVVHTWELWLGAGVLLGLAALVAYRRLYGSVWAVWILASLAPFLLLTEATMLIMPAGPSRYIYAASAGSSVLLAWGVGLGLGRLRPWGRRAGAGILLGLVALSSYHGLQKAQGLTLYKSGRYYTAARNWEKATDHLRRAIELGGTVLPLEDAYIRLLFVLLAQGEPVDEVLAAARTRLPDSQPLFLMVQVLAAADPDPQVRAAALERIAATIRSNRRIKSQWVAEYDLSNIVRVYFQNYGTGLMVKGEYARALIPLQDALKYDPQNRQIRLNIGLTLFKMGHYAQAARTWHRAGESVWALGAWEKAVETAPEDRALRLELARSLVHNGALSEATVQYVDLARSGAEAEVLFELATVCLQQGQGDPAKEAFARGIALYGTKTAEDLGLRQQLQDLAAKGVQTASEILEIYW